MTIILCRPSLEDIHVHNQAMLKAARGKNKPLVCYLQTYAPSDSRMPTPQELRAELYLSICHGARVYFPYYAWSDPPKVWSLTRDSELRSYLLILNKELNAMKPFLFSSDFRKDSIEALDKAGLTYLAKNTRPTGHIDRGQYHPGG